MLIINTILPQFILILIGYFLTKSSVFSKKDFWTVTEKLVFYVLFPPLIFLSVAKANLQVAQCTHFLSVSIAAMLTAVFLAWAANFLIKESSWTKWSIFHCGFRFNTYIGFAICSSLYGTEGLAFLSLLIACWVPISNVIATAGLAHAAKAEGSATAKKSKNFWWTVCTNPLIIATCLGLVFNTLHIPVPTIADEILSSLGKASLAMGLICIGAALKIKDLTRYRRLVLVGSAQRLLAVPAVAVAFAILFGLAPLESSVLLLFGALPTAQSCYVMTSAMGGDAAAVADLTSAEVIFSAITLPIWIMVALQFFSIS